jgi:predicted nucleic acid-binding protein
VRRNLARLLEGDPLERARERFRAHWRALDVIAVDAETCELAAQLAAQTGARTLDALHLGAAAVAAGDLPIVTFDRRLAEAARPLGWEVRGA